jgi:hypothetical protein
MPSNKITPYVYRVNPGGNTAEAVIYAVYRCATDATTSLKHWEVAFSAGGLSGSLDTGMYVLVLKNLNSEARLMLRRARFGTATWTVACSYHPDDGTGTILDDPSKLPTGWTTSTNVRNAVKIADWEAAGTTSPHGSPETFITGNGTAYGLNAGGWPMSQTKMDVIETEDSLTVACYHSITTLGFNATPLQNTAWLYTLHAGEILTPDNRSDPDFKSLTKEELTGEGIMCGWYGFQTGGIAYYFMGPGSHDCFARIGDKNPVTNNDWERFSSVLIDYTYGSNANAGVPPLVKPEPIQLIPVGDDGAEYERLAPYRFRTLNSGYSLLTRFIRQRYYEMEELLPPIGPGTHVDSRVPRVPSPGSEVAWLHQASWYQNMMRNTLHVWCKDGESSTTNFFTIL